MINDAEKFADDDKKVKELVEAKNELEQYSYSLKNQVGDTEKLGGKLSDEEKKTIEEAADEAISWLESNKDKTTVDEIKERKKELESKVHPIISKLYAGGAGGETPPTEGEGDGDSKDEL